MHRNLSKTSPQIQYLRWIEVANPRNPAAAGLLWLAPSIRPRSKSGIYGLDLEPDCRKPRTLNGEGFEMASK